MSDIVSLFFSRTREDELNKMILEYTYEIPLEELSEYVYNIISCPVTAYLDWLDSAFITTTISKDDAPQFSNIDDATTNVIDGLIEAGDIGYTNLEIGQILQNDGIVRTDGTNIKYGENHAKTARYLGLLYSINRHYYVSGVGYIWRTLNQQQRAELYCRLFIRTPLFRTVYLFSKAGKVDMRSLFDMLAESTYIRRRGNIRTLFEKLRDSNEYDWDSLLDLIIY